MSIEVKNLAKSFRCYEKKEGILRNFFFREYTNNIVIKDISFNINRGERVAIIGRNGAGKTTLMKLLSGVMVPTGGDIAVLGFRPSDRKKEYKKRISLVMGQKQQLWWDVSAKDNFELVKAIYEIPKEEYKKNLYELVEQLDISKVLNRPIRTLSLGERMKCELLASLLYKPDILFLDEPTIGLDLISRNDIRNFIKKYSEDNNATVILTSHNTGDIENVCNRSIFIDEGEIFYDGTFKGFSSRFSEYGILRVNCIERNYVDWNKYGKVISSSNDIVKIQVQKEKVKDIRYEIQEIEGVVNTTIEDMDAEEIVKLFYEKGNSKSD